MSAYGELTISMEKCKGLRFVTLPELIMTNIIKGALARTMIFFFLVFFSLLTSPWEILTLQELLNFVSAILCPSLPYIWDRTSVSADSGCSA